MNDLVLFRFILDLIYTDLWDWKDMCTLVRGMHKEQSEIRMERGE